MSDLFIKPVAGLNPKITKCYLVYFSFPRFRFGVRWPNNWWPFRK
jgi:hypothetical protein